MAEAGGPAAGGLFKLRGIGAACEFHARRGTRRFISSSGGNAGIAVAFAGRCLSIPVTVVVPETTTERARALIRQEGAEVIVHGKAWHEANALAQSMLGEADAFIHPFDDALLWQGHATLVDEVAASGWRPDVVLLSVGGGGLFSGVVEGLQRNGWGAVPVITAETAGAASFAGSLQAGRRIELERIDSVATSLGRSRCASGPSNWGAATRCGRGWSATARRCRPASASSMSSAFSSSRPVARRWPWPMPGTRRCGTSNG